MKDREEERLLALEALSTRPPVSLFKEPIEYVFADHFRQRTLCKILDGIAGAETIDTEMVQAALAFLKTEMGPHVLDEELDLFPLLRRRVLPEDEIDMVLGQLSQEHAADETDALEIVRLLEALTSSGNSQGVDVGAANLLQRFASNERQHLILENAIVLPLARVRLTETDCHQLGRSMADRRGIMLDD